MDTSRCEHADPKTPGALWCEHFAVVFNFPDRSFIRLPLALNKPYEVVEEILFFYLRLVG